MAKVLRSSSLLNSLVAILAYDDDDVVSMWETLGSGRTRYVGSGLTATGLATPTTETFGSSTGKAIFTDGDGDKIVIDTPVSLPLDNGEYLSFYAPVIDYDAFGASTMSILIDFSSTAGSAGDAFGVNNVPGTGASVIRLAGGNLNPGLTAWAGNTKFGAGGTVQFATTGGTNIQQYYHGAEGGSIATDGPTTGNNGNYFNTYALRAFMNADSVYNRKFQGKALMLGIWNRQLDSTDFSALHADPLGAVFATSGGVVVPRQAGFQHLSNFRG